MRSSNGKLVAVWSPGLHGAGVSTVTDTVGFALQHFTGKKVLILNNSGCLSYMERFLENDIEIKYTLDNLKIFNGCINTEHIFTYATCINKNLYMIAGSKLGRNITGEDEFFDERLLQKCLEAFEIVIADLNTGIRDENEVFISKADAVLSVVTPNEIMLDDMLEGAGGSRLHEYIYDKKTIMVFNKLYDGWDMKKELKKLNKKYDLEFSFGLPYDGDVFAACCRDKQFYSFMSEQLRKKKTVYIEQTDDICGCLIERLYLDTAEASGSKEQSVFSLFSNINGGRFSW